MPIYLQHGNLIDYVPPTDTSTEDVVFMGGLVGIPQTFIPAGELGALSVDGVYMFTKKDGVSVNLGDVVKYCGTTKLAQDSNADLTLGVAVADAEADSLGVKVKINSVLPTDGGGGGGDIEIAVNCGLAFGEQGELFVNINTNYGLGFNSNGELIATGGSGGDGIQNLATGTNSLSILGAATTSCYSVTIGADAYADGYYSTALGTDAKATANNSTAIGYQTAAFGPYTTAIGYGAYAFEQGATAISAWNNDGNVKTQIYLIGSGSMLSTPYCCGEAGLGFVCRDQYGNILKSGTIKLSALMTENTDSFEPMELS